MTTQTSIIQRITDSPEQRYLLLLNDGGFRVDVVKTEGLVPFWTISTPVETITLEQRGESTIADIIETVVYFTVTSLEDDGRWLTPEDIQNAPTDFEGVDVKRLLRELTRRGHYQHQQN
jgi:hypothetical protein